MKFNRKLLCSFYVQLYKNTCEYVCGYLLYNCLLHTIGFIPAILNWLKKTKTILSYLLCTFFIAPTRDIWITWIKTFHLSNYIKQLFLESFMHNCYCQNEKKYLIFKFTDLSGVRFKNTIFLMFILKIFIIWQIT